MISPDRIAKIRWNCRRGMLELDLILNNFFDNAFSDLAETQIDAFERLLSEQDPDIYHWLMSEDLPQDQHVAEIINIIKQSHFN